MVVVFIDIVWLWPDIRYAKPQHWTVYSFEQVDDFKYLGVNMSSRNNKLYNEIKLSKFRKPWISCHA